MVFLGGHNIDFSGSKKKLLDTMGSRLSTFQFENLQFFMDYEQAFFEGREFQRTVHANDRWQFSDFSLDGMFGIKERQKVFLLIGPYGLMLRISDTYIEFMTPAYNRPDWYSPGNAKAVAEWRKYLKQIITLLGGSEALYITHSYFNKYPAFFRDVNMSFTERIKILKKRHRANKKLFVTIQPSVPAKSGFCPLNKRDRASAADTPFFSHVEI
jgi:hypothetical protein